MTSLSPYFDLKKNDNGEPYIETNAKGMALLHLGSINKGTGFSKEEREALGLEGLLPPRLQSMDQQLERAYANFSELTSPIKKYQFLRGLQDRNETLYFALLVKHVTEMMPIVYTPTVGQAVREFSLRYQVPRGVTFTPDNIDQADAILANVPWDDVRMIVVTDSSAILGIGDQGFGGIGISIGKLALYTAGGGVCPWQTLPVGLDVGTNSQEHKNDPYYLGVDSDRLTGEGYLEFADKFIAAVKKRWPNCIIQWEDFSKNEAYNLLERNREVISSFNDDIQGTGAVALAGVLAACARKGQSLKDQRVALSGAGAGGVGVAWAIVQGMIREGLTPEEAHSRVYVLDSRGLLTDARATMDDYKRPYAQKHESIADWEFDGDNPNMLETLRNGKVTVLLGLSGQAGQFDADVIATMMENDAQPIIFPLSNPTSNCEALPVDILTQTNGQALVATGSPFDPVELNGKSYAIGQGNNAFIFPGLGFAAILAQASQITDGMILAGAYALAEYTLAHHSDTGLIYPPIGELRTACKVVTKQVLEQAIADGVAQNSALDGADLDAYIEANMWKPEYLPVQLAD